MKKLNDKGLSLVELVIAIAMSTIVVGAAAMFLYNAERSYRVAEYTVDLQMEAQILMEQMSNWVLDSNFVEIRNKGTSDGILVLYQIPNNGLKYKSTQQGDGTYKVEPRAGDQLATRKVIFTKDKKLYMVEETESAVDEYVNALKGTGFNESSMPDVTNDNIIGDYVSSFNVDIPFGVDAKRINSVIVRLGMSEGVSKQAQSYSVKNEFSIRNYALEVAPSATPAGGE